jgi:predicted nucleic acid-binding protein
VRRVFADTVYLAALFNQRDSYHEQALQASSRLVGVRVVTTDAVLLEFLTFFAGFGPRTRAATVDFVQDLFADPQVEILPLSRTSFHAGLALYGDRLDKDYSGVDCVSMQAMRELGISEVLTHDHHFEQEGFVLLMSQQATR